MRIAFDERDRKRFNLPEVVEFDEFDPTVGDIVLLEEQVGLTFDAWNDLLIGDEVKVETDGEITTRYRRTYRTHHVVLWLAVRRAGSDVAYKDFDVSMKGMRLLNDADEPGKEEDPDGSESPDSPPTNQT